MSFFISRYFFSDNSATSQILSQLPHSEVDLDCLIAASIIHPLSAWRLLNTLADRDDILPRLLILAWRISRRRGSHVINWLQDIYLEFSQIMNLIR